MTASVPRSCGEAATSLRFGSVPFHSGVKRAITLKPGGGPGCPSRENRQKVWRLSSVEKKLSSWLPRPTRRARPTKRHPPVRNSPNTDHKNGQPITLVGADESHAPKARKLVHQGHTRESLRRLCRRTFAGEKPQAPPRTVPQPPRQGLAVATELITPRKRSAGVSYAPVGRRITASSRIEPCFFARVFGGAGFEIMPALKRVPSPLCVVLKPEIPGRPHFAGG